MDHRAAWASLNPPILPQLALCVRRDVELIKPVSVEVREQRGVLKPPRVAVDVFNAPFAVRIASRLKQPQP